ncbi:hypothetical protein [Lentibacillus kimchii]|uniref:hypothetical protein n=1 Tax=Lentibacillus kimchii TaxID=1542911 RepID=UPI0036D3EC5B
MKQPSKYGLFHLLLWTRICYLYPVFIFFAGVMAYLFVKVKTSGDNLGIFA